MGWRMSKMDGRVCVVTGANTGIGRVTATELARRGARVILACRSEERTQPVLDEIRALDAAASVGFVPLDLGSLDSVRGCADTLLAQEQAIHVLINNAGLAGTRGITSDGFELAFGVNHLGHFLLTMLLLERLKNSAPARIVNVSSRGHYSSDSIDYEILRRSTKSVTGLPEYQVSKLANVLFTVELARRLKGTGVTAYSLHPGVVASDVWRRVPWPFRALMKFAMISNEDGAKTTLHCATSDDVAGESGLYYDKCAPKEPNPVVHDPELARELWAHSATWCGLPE